VINPVFPLPVAPTMQMKSPIENSKCFRFFLFCAEIVFDGEFVEVRAEDEPGGRSVNTIV
jgi:hypothetical protein